MRPQSVFRFGVSGWCLGNETIIRKLIGSIDHYLSGLVGNGIEEVRKGIERWRSGPFSAIPHRAVSACGQLDPALEQLQQAHPALAAAIRDASRCLYWTHYDAYARDLIGSRFAEGHAFTTLIGKGSFLSSEDFNLGLFLIEPNIFYRDHRHAAPELYAPLTGPHGWRFRPGESLVEKPAHEAVWNEPWQPHATLTGDTPFLAIYCWTKDVDEAAEVVPSSDWEELEKVS